MWMSVCWSPSISLQIGAIWDDQIVVNPLWWISDFFHYKYVFVLYIIPTHWNGMDCWYLLSWKIRSGEALIHCPRPWKSDCCWDVFLVMLLCHVPYVILLKIQYIPINMHTVFALLCFVMVIHWLIFPYPSGLLHWHCGNLTIAPVPAKQPWWIWINTSCEFIMNDCITTTKQSTTKRCAYFLGYTVRHHGTGNKSSPHPVLMQIYDDIWHH